MYMSHYLHSHGHGGTLLRYLHSHGPGGMVLPVILGLAFYIYLAICLQFLAKKTGTKHGWMGWVPILNVYLFCKIGGKPGWWMVLFLIPFVNIFFAILVFMAIAQARGKPYWWGILIVIPLVRAIVPGYLAFSGPKDPVVHRTGPGLRPPANACA